MIFKNTLVFYVLHNFIVRELLILFSLQKWRKLQHGCRDPTVEQRQDGNRHQGTTQPHQAGTSGSFILENLSKVLLPRVFQITGHDHSRTVLQVQFITIWL